MIRINSDEQGDKILLDKDDGMRLYEILISLPEQVGRITWDDLSGNPDLTPEQVKDFVRRFVDETGRANKTRREAGQPQL